MQDHIRVSDSRRVLIFPEPRRRLDVLVEDVLKQRTKRFHRIIGRGLHNVFH